MSDPILLEKMDQLLARNDQLADEVHRLAQVVSGRLAPPVMLLDYTDAAKLGLGRRKLERLAATGLFTDRRGGKRQGSKRMFLADEIDAYLADGESGVQRLRSELGRD